jgi:hypothetical protein
VRNNGSTTVLILGVLGFLSIVTLSAYVFLEYSIKEIYKNEAVEQQRNELIKEAETVMSFFLDDMTPYADSRIDAVWEHVENCEDRGIQIRLTDISSYFGVNWIRKEMLNYGNLLKFGKSSDELQQYRWDTGIHLNMDPDYLDFFTHDVLNQYFTPYNFFNINICDEFALENLYFVRTGDRDKARLFRQRIQDFWKGSKPGKPRMIEPADLKSFLGLEYKRLFPLINAEPVFNVHFVPEEIISQLFSYQYHSVPHNVLEYIMDRRMTQEWSISELEMIIGEKYKKTFLHHYIGVTTWFWQIEITSSNDGLSPLTLRWIVVRIPQESEREDEIEYRLLEEEFTQ